MTRREDENCIIRIIAVEVTVTLFRMAEEEMGRHNTGRPEISYSFIYSTYIAPLQRTSTQRRSQSREERFEGDVKFGRAGQQGTD